MAPFAAAARRSACAQSASGTWSRSVTGSSTKHPSLTSKILGPDDLEHGDLACEGASIPTSLALSTDHDEACSCKSIQFGLQRSLSFADGTEALYINLCRYIGPIPESL